MMGMHWKRITCSLLHWCISCYPWVVLEYQVSVSSSLTYQYFCTQEKILHLLVSTSLRPIEWVRFRSHQAKAKSECNVAWMDTSKLHRTIQTKWKRFHLNGLQSHSNESESDVAFAFAFTFTWQEWTMSMAWSFGEPIKHYIVSTTIKLLIQLSWSFQLIVICKDVVLICGFDWLGIWAVLCESHNIL